MMTNMCLKDGERPVERQNKVDYSLSHNSYCNRLPYRTGHTFIDRWKRKSRIFNCNTDNHSVAVGVDVLLYGNCKREKTGITK